MLWTVDCLVANAVVATPWAITAMPVGTITGIAQALICRGGRKRCTYEIPPNVARLVSDPIWAIRYAERLVPILPLSPAPLSQETLEAFF